RFSGPLLDRFDLRVLVTRPSVEELLDAGRGESSATVRARVAATRRVAIARQGRLNAQLSGEDLEEYAPLDAAGRNLLRHELESGRLTGRGLHRIRRVARTLADGRGQSDVVEEVDIATALSLRAQIGVRHAADG
ncbi:MAG: ATP-dependent protease, partial [Actinomycetota bacterium]